MTIVAPLATTRRPPLTVVLPADVATDERVMPPAVACTSTPVMSPPVTCRTPVRPAAAFWSVAPACKVARPDACNVVAVAAPKELVVAASDVAVAAPKELVVAASAAMVAEGVESAPTRHGRPDACEMVVKDMLCL